MEAPAREPCVAPCLEDPGNEVKGKRLQEREALRHLVPRDGGHAHGGNSLVDPLSAGIREALGEYGPTYSTLYLCYLVALQSTT